MKRFDRVFSILIVILLPVAALCLSLNLAVRLPDVYQYAFKSTEQLKTANLTVDSDEFGELISDFMIGKNVDFAVAQGDEPDKQYGFFDAHDIKNLKNIRFRLNIVLAFGAVAVATSVFAFMTCKNIDEGAVARYAIKRAQISAVVLIAGMLVFFLISAAMRFGFWENYIKKFDGSENFYLVMTQTLLRYLYIVWLVIAAIFEAIMLYAASKLAKPKRIFSRGNY